MEWIRVGDIELGVFSVSLEPAAWPEALSRSERAVVRGLVRDRTHREIARMRGVSEATIHEQVRRVLAKMEVSSTSELVSLLARDRSIGTESEPKGTV